MIQTETKTSNQAQAIQAQAIQAQAIQHFIERMDIKMIDVFLDNDKTYQEFKKDIFIDKLQQAFAQFADLGDTRLIAFEGRCNSCDKTKTGFTFIGNKSNNYMSIIFDTADNKINDLYECGGFKNQQADLNLEERIYISVLPDFPF